RRRECAVPGGRAVDVVAVARPDRDGLALLETVEQLVGFLDHELRPAILALPRRDRGPARLRDELHAVADPENGYAELEQLLVQRRHVLVVHGRRAAREDDPLRQPLADEVGGYGRRVDLAVDALLADAPGNELRELRAVVEYEDAVLRVHSFSPGRAARPRRARDPPASPARGSTGACHPPRALPPDGCARCTSTPSRSRMRPWCRSRS